MKRIILSEKQLLNSTLKSMRISGYLSELRNKSLLPLFSDNKKLLVIARLIGALFSDGNLYIGKNNYREISFTLGQKEDVKDVIKDLDLLGFRYHFSERINTRKIDLREFQMHTWKVKCCSTALWLLFKSLGAPVGNKTIQNYKIPDWIMKAKKEIKKEFLKAYIGGDGPKVTISLIKREKKQPYNKVSINDIEFYKKALYARSGIIYAEQLKELLNRFGVKVNKIFSKRININKKKISIIHICISSSVESAYSYCKIGFSYCKQKRDATFPVSQFLEYLIQKRRIWKEKYEKALNLYNTQDKSIQKISKILDVSENTVYGWIKLRKKPNIGYHKIKYPAWLKGGIKNGC